jgi:redox-sensitive bicupin YhaK (pirin superfamily)
MHKVELGVDEMGAQQIDMLIEGAEKDLGDFTVLRVLPFAGKRSVGPFVFFDHMGPAVLGVGSTVDVRPHPHIGLATITYMFDGEIMHRDSLGEVRAIQPGAINWMTAGRGIVHSERTPEENRSEPQNLHGLQLWVALPEDQQEIEPTFTHYPAEDIPELHVDGCAIRVMVGEAHGVVSPVVPVSPTLYIEYRLDDGASVLLPGDAEEQAIYLISGSLATGDQKIPPRQMAVLASGESVEVTATGDAHFVIVGGQPLGKRHIYWNLVSTSLERIEQAKDDWKNDRFDRVPGETEFIPLPD